MIEPMVLIHFFTPPNMRSEINFIEA